MRFTLFATVCVAGSLLAAAIGCGKRPAVDSLSSKIAGTSPAGALTKSVPSDPQSVQAGSPATASKGDSRRAPSGKPNRPSHLFM